MYHDRDNKNRRLFVHRVHILGQQLSETTEGPQTGFESLQSLLHNIFRVDTENEHGLHLQLFPTIEQQERDFVIRPQVPSHNNRLGNINVAWVKRMRKSVSWGNLGYCEFREHSIFSEVFENLRKDNYEYSPNLH